MADTLRDGVKEVADQVRPSALEPKLEEAMQNQPLLPHLIEPRNALLAAAIGCAVALVLYVLMSPVFAGLGLIVAFFAAWFGLAVRAHEAGRPRGRS